MLVPWQLLDDLLILLRDAKIQGCHIKVVTKNKTKPKIKIRNDILSGTTYEAKVETISSFVYLSSFKFFPASFEVAHTLH